MTALLVVVVVEVVLGLVRREDELDGGAGVLRQLRADVVRVDLVGEEVVDLLRRMRTVWKR